MPASNSPQKRRVLVFGWGFPVMQTAYCENPNAEFHFHSVIWEVWRENSMFTRKCEVFGETERAEESIHSIGDSQ